MSIQELFIASNETLLKVVTQINADKWSIMMPPGMSSKPGTLGEAVRYHTYDDAWVPDVLAGKSKVDVGETYEPLLQVPDAEIVKNYQTYNERASQAVRDFSDLNRTTHLSYGDFPAKDYLQHIVTFRAFRSYDIAKLIGTDTTMDADLVQALLDELTPVIDGYRQMGVFPPPLEVSADANPQTTLLAMVGRS